jgi:EAL domain-containing protein (putative c-di-GMP-specific phosphodiesterase class I)/ActR/RegA family two-component response regulator
MIDDDPAFCRLVKRVAEPHGFDVITTDDPSIFKNSIKSSMPTVIVMDLQIPGTDGIELLRDLAVVRCTASIVLASGLDLRTLDAALRLGSERGLKMDGVLQKPVRLQDLKDLLAKHKPTDSTLLADDLSQAIAGDQLFLEYQPKIDGSLGRIAGVEALVRWLHPSRGVIRPDQFIALAEETDLIEPLTEWVFSTAAKQAASWQQKGLALDVAINVSAKNLRDLRLPDRLARHCQEFGIAPETLTIELTETSAMRDAVQMMDVLTRLRVKGFKLSIDDFGTGYSSLIQLRKMPFSELKVDISFVMHTLRDKDCRVIVEVIIDLARKLGLTSVAEGVETEEIWNTLLGLGCDRGQGYYLGRPMSADRIVSTYMTSATVGKDFVAANVAT